jgi:FixJ family two-component response regulator
VAPLIAIIDDDQSVRRSLKRLIASFGLRVEGFGSAEEFVQSGHLHDTVCLVLDVRLPGMSGVEFQNRLAGDGPRIPIVFITAHDDEATREQALEDGALDFLFKPVDQNALLNAIRSALGFQSELQCRSSSHRAGME